MSTAPLDSTRVLDMMKEFNTYLGRTTFSSYRTSTPSVSTINECFSPVEPKTPLFDSPHSKLKRDLIQKEAEVNHLQVQIAKMKSDSKSEEPAAKKACIELEKNAEISRQQYEGEKEKNLRLTHQLQLLEKEVVSLRASLAATIDQAKTLNEQLENKLATSYKKMNLLQVELEELRIDNSGTVKQLQFEVNRLKAEIELADDEVKQSKEQMKIVTRQMQERSAMEKEMLQMEKDAKIKELEHQLASREEDEVIGRSMKGELRRLKEVETKFHALQLENKLLLERQENMLLLKENVLSLEEELAREQKRGDTVHQLTLENETLKKRLEDWEELGSVHGENRSPATISRYLSRLQKNEILLHEECGQLRADLRVSETNTKELQTEREKTNVEVERLKNIIASQSTLTRRVQRKQLLLTKECECYKKIINSYEDDVTLNISAASRERVEMLENLVAQYKTLNESCMDNSATSTRETLLQEEVQNLRQVLSQLKAETQRKQEEKSLESSKQILHFRMNPLEQATRQNAADVRNLREENQRLKTRLQVLQERGREAADITAETNERLQEQGDVTTLEALREQLNTAKTNNKRYIEAFKKSSREFREVCYVLTGYRIDTIDLKRYKLSHMYADSQDDYLLFQQTSEEKLEMLETEYAKTLTHLTELHLEKQRSIPAFLSSLTLELFCNQTYMRSESTLT